MILEDSVGYPIKRRRRFWRTDCHDVCSKYQNYESVREDARFYKQKSDRTEVRSSESPVHFKSTEKIRPRHISETFYNYPVKGPNSEDTSRTIIALFQE